MEGAFLLDVRGIFLEEDGEDSGGWTGDGELGSSKSSVDSNLLITTSSASREFGEFSPDPRSMSSIDNIFKKYLKITKFQQKIERWIQFLLNYNIHTSTEEIYLASYFFITTSIIWCTYTVNIMEVEGRRCGTTSHCRRCAHPPLELSL